LIFVNLTNVFGNHALKIGGEYRARERTEISVISARRVFTTNFQGVVADTFVKYHEDQVVSR